MSHIDPQVDREVLADIRRAAFELRVTDPQEAVRLLRRAAEAGGGAEVLARGALGEIYLEELGDLDGAEHEFRAVLHAVPGLPAAELGLARVLHETGERRGARGSGGRRPGGRGRPPPPAAARGGRGRGPRRPPPRGPAASTSCDLSSRWA